MVKTPADFMKDESCIYEQSFDSIITQPGTKYNPNFEKHRIEIRESPYLLIRLDTVIENHYGIKSTESKVQASRLGMSKVLHSPDIKTILLKYNEIAENGNDRAFISILQTKSHYWSTESNKIRCKMPVYEWVGLSVNSLIHPLGMFQSDIVISAYFIGLEHASLIPQRFKQSIDKEIEGFWKQLKQRAVSLNSLLEG